MTRPAAPARPVRRTTTPARITYRRRRWGAVLVGLVLLVGAGLGVRALLYGTALADVRDVRVTGVPAAVATQARDTAAVPLGSPLAGIDTAAIAARVATLPTVGRVSVAKDWPHTVVVDITARVPVATVVAPGGVALVDSTGVVYPGAAPAGLPRLTFGPVGPDDPATRAALAALAALPAAVRTQVVTVGATAGGGATGQVEFGLTDARRVAWGTADRSADKATVLVPLLTQKGSVYDVTSPDLPTVRR